MINNIIFFIIFLLIMNPVFSGNNLAPKGLNKEIISWTSINEKSKSLLEDQLNHTITPLIFIDLYFTTPGFMLKKVDSLEQGIYLSDVLVLDMAFEKAGISKNIIKKYNLYNLGTLDIKTFKKYITYNVIKKVFIELITFYNEVEKIFYSHPLYPKKHYPFHPNPIIKPFSIIPNRLSEMNYLIKEVYVLILELEKKYDGLDIKKFISQAHFYLKDKYDILKTINYNYTQISS